MRKMLLLLVGVSLPLLSLAGRRDKARKAIEDEVRDDRGPATSAAEIPALSKLLEKAGWQATPELAGVFHAGHIFEVNGVAHSALATRCIAAEAQENPYTAADVITSLQAGVQVGGLAARGAVTGEVVKKIKFGTPVQVTVPALDLVITDECVEKLKRLPVSRLQNAYVIQEVLRAQISEQTCGRVDVSGRIVGLGSADTELQQACSQTSLEPVAVGYRTVPLTSLLDLGGAVVADTTGPRPTIGSGGGSGGEFDDVSGIAAEIRRAEELKARLEEEQESCLSTEAAKVRQAATSSWTTLGQLRDLATTEAGRSAAEVKVQQFVALYDGKTVTCRNELGERSETVTPPEVAAARLFLASVSAGAEWTGPSGYAMVGIAAGSFTMGSPASEKGRGSDETEHRVTLSKGFLMGKTEVTQGLWRAVMGSNPSQKSYEGVSLLGDGLPVQNVSWCDAVAFANKLSSRDGLSAAYSGVDQCNTSKGTSVRWERSSDGYRLPTEAEWEYAARAGEHRLFSGAESYEKVCGVGNVSDLGAKAKFSWSDDWSKQCSDRHHALAPVGAYSANPWGLHDMTGNVWEWCWDWYADYSGTSTDPVGAQSGTNRVRRGGSWLSDPRDARVAYRYRDAPDSRYDGLGLRLVRTSP